ncbi:MAG: hypothetical protein M0R06_10115 [Sphaerochaeta sp.]|jgi:hypothetical protein|nr:hypothetical protein [Sphaerochaeta sp.]
MESYNQYGNPYGGQLAVVHDEAVRIIAEAIRQCRDVGVNGILFQDEIVSEQGYMFCAGRSGVVAIPSGNISAIPIGIDWGDEILMAAQFLREGGISLDFVVDYLERTRGVGALTNQQLQTATRFCIPIVSAKDIAILGVEPCQRRY